MKPPILMPQRRPRLPGRHRAGAPARAGAAPLKAWLAAAWVGLAGAGAPSTGVAAPLTLASVPLFVTSNAPANVLMMYGNANSMDADPAGVAVGSASAASKSEIARGVIKSLITSYQGTLNMGLLAYQQYTSGTTAVRPQALHHSPYDVSYNPLNYDPTFSGPRASTTKKFRVPNPAAAGQYIYYNVALPLYAASPQGNGFCYSATARAFSNGENPTTGPWDTYSCYAAKSGSSDALPTDATSAQAAGYASYLYDTQYYPTDSDLGQGITDFGRFLAWSYVSQAWFSNGSPGAGYVHVPIAPLDATQAGKLNTKLATSQFSTNAPLDARYPLQNAGLTPLEGTVLTAQSYFSGTLSDTAQGGPLAAPPQSCGKNFLVLLTDGLPSVTRSGTPSADVAATLAAVSTATTNLYAQTRTATYVVGFALPYGVNPAQLDTIAQAGRTGSAYNAADQTTLTQTLGAVFADIIAQSGAAATVSLNSAAVSAASRVYQARFNSADWSGQLLSVALNADGTPGATQWDAGRLIANQPAGTRTVLTYKPSTRAGIAFRWPAAASSPTAAELDAAQVTALNTSASGTVDNLGAQRLDWVRGSSANEGSGSNGLRVRPTSKLGDIVGSAPVYVAAPAAGYADAAYAAFRSARAARAPMVYVGANDGMLHGFDATTGQERLAYVPSAVYANLPALASRGYSHRFFVDAPPVSADANLAGAWRTVLASGLGAGGRGIFVLDVTDPAAFSESNAATLVRFEFGAAQDGDVGFVMHRPALVRLNSGKWAAVFGNGYNGTATGQAALFVVDLETGALVRKIATGAGSVTTPNALTGVSVVDQDGNQTADVVYAGDLQGNLWKFDLSSASPGSWALANAGRALFSTAGTFGAAPITQAPEVSRHPQGGLMVAFGTGKYLELSDVTSSAANYFFGIWDNGTAVTAATQLVQQTVLSTPVGPDGATYRLISANAVDWSRHRGWYLVLPEPGERSVSEPVLRNGRVIFTTLTPSSVQCTAGGTSWLMELDFLSGTRLPVPPFDLNADGRITAADTFSGSVPAGRKIQAIAGTPAVQTGLGTPDAPLERKLINESSARLSNVLESGSAAMTRRTAWQQLR